MMVEVKICGLTDAPAMQAALEAGADYVGLVFYPPSPRNLAVATAAHLAQFARGRARIVALVVDPDDALVAEIAATVRPDLIQLHGSETPARAKAIASLSGMPLIKAVKVADKHDVASAAAFDGIAEMILYDAKAPKDLANALPGGNGLSFDWRMLEEIRDKRKFMLSGGLDAGNVATALRLTRAPAVDVSSGVEAAPGRKDPERIRAFIAAVRAAERHVLERSEANG